MTDCTDGHDWGFDGPDLELECANYPCKETITIDQLLNKYAAFKRDFIGVHQISQDVIDLAEEIRKTCPQGKIVKRWVLEARARGFSMRMLCERREADALLADKQEQEDGFCPVCDAGVGHCTGPHTHKGNDEIPF